MPKIEVLKFGGTSVKTVARIQHVAAIVRERAKAAKLIVVVSAMGDTTDYLVNLARRCSEVPDRRELDVLLATGEQTTIALLSMTLRDLGVRAKSLTGQQLGILTDKNHTEAQILQINADVVSQSFRDNDVLVVAGFQGVNEYGDITTLGRGGSDTTAVAIAAALDSCDCDIYTDVDGVYTADPNLLADAELLERLSYDEMLAMARLGAQVLHPRAVELAQLYQVSVRVRNTFKPQERGTLIEGGEIFGPEGKATQVALAERPACIPALNIPPVFPFLKKISAALAKTAGAGLKGSNERLVGRNLNLG